ncbi:hypothetical protein JCM8097_005882 [Rhodosporidiobolus ruineniae]
MSSSTPSSEAVRPPRASLDSLSTELEKRIVELCAEQDETLRNWTERVLELNPRTVHVDSSVPDLVRSVRAAHPQTLGTLFCLSREWSTIAAPYRFKTLKASRAGHPVLQFALAPRRGHLFNHLELDSSSSPELSSLLLLLPNFTKIRRITFHDKPLVSTLRELGLDSPPDVNSTSSYVGALIRQLLRTASALDLHLKNSWRILEMVKHAPALTALALDLRRVDFPFSALKKVLNEARGLRSLELHLAEDDDFDLELELDLAGAVADPDPLPALQTLVLHAYRAPDTFFTFAAAFSASLVCLELDLYPDETSYDLPGLEPHVFPALTSLRLVGSFSNAETFMASCTPTTLPALESLYIDMNSIAALGPANPIFAVLEQHLRVPSPRFKRLQLFDVDWPFSAADLAFARAWAQLHNVTVLVDPFASFPDHRLLRKPGPHPFRTADPDDLDELVPAIGRVVEFVSSWYERAKRAPTQEEFERLAAVLRAAELERVAAET